VRIFQPVPAGRLADIATRWSRLRGIDDRGAAGWETRWEYLSQTYRPAMERYVFHVLRTSGGGAPGRDEVEDVVQGFLAECVSKQLLSRADPATTRRFRAFLQTLLRRYVYGHLDHVNARKRRPALGTTLVPLDSAEEPQAAPSPANGGSFDEFDRGWVEAAVLVALDRLKSAQPRYAEVIEGLIADAAGAKSATASAAISPVLRHRARTRFEAVFLEVLRETIRDERDFADEWRAIEPFLP
jgi:hypothetical protein